MSVSHPVDLVDARKQLAGVGAEAVDELGIELRAPPGAEHLDRRVHPADAMECLHVVGHVDDPHDAGDLFAGQLGRRALAVPALKGLLKGVTHLRTEAESQRQITGGLAVGGHRLLDFPRPAGQEPPDHGEPPNRGAAAGDMADHETHHGQTGQIDQVAVGPNRSVVTEPLAHFVGVDHTAHPGQERHVEDGRPVLVGQPLEVGHPHGDQGLPDDVLLGLTQSQIRRQ